MEIAAGGQKTVKSYSQTPSQIELLKFHYQCQGGFSEFSMLSKYMKEISCRINRACDYLLSVVMHLGIVGEGKGLLEQVSIVHKSEDQPNCHPLLQKHLTVSVFPHLWMKSMPVLRHREPTMHFWLPLIEGKIFEKSLLYLWYEKVRGSKVLEMNRTAKYRTLNLFYMFHQIFARLDTSESYSGVMM